MTTNNSTGTHSIAELITEYHQTLGEKPPLLIGPTITLINTHVYLFGGRLHSTRQLSNKLYILDLPTKVWRLAKTKNTPPLGRYFHSASHYEKRILFFGGMGVQATETVPLNDLVFLNLESLSWEYPALPSIDAPLPSPRYAHLSTAIRNKLIIVGGQDQSNNYLEDICLFDLHTKSWSSLSTQHHLYGAYRSSAIAVTPIVPTPPIAPNMDLVSDSDELQDDILLHVYSNLQPTANVVNRVLHTWKLKPKSQSELLDQSSKVASGTVVPPPIKFPMGFMCGQQFILAGPYTISSEGVCQFQVWALDTTTYVWTKIEAGPLLSTGAWLKGVLCENSNRFIVFGHAGRSMLDDYRDRVVCCDQMACVDMEIFGIYRPPRTSFSPFSQGIGLALLKDPLLADLQITSLDHQQVGVNSALLAQRWPLVQSLLTPLTHPQIDTDTKHQYTLSFPDNYVVLIAFLQYIYTDHLVTAQQHQPYILARLLFIADLFQIERLKSLAIHALHQMLNIQTATMIYESALLSNAISLQVRALRVMLNAKKMLQRHKLDQQKKQLAAEQPTPAQLQLQQFKQLKQQQKDQSLPTPAQLQLQQMKQLKQQQQKDQKDQPTPAQLQLQQFRQSKQQQQKDQPTPAQLQLQQFKQLKQQQQQKDQPTPAQLQLQQFRQSKQQQQKDQPTPAQLQLQQMKQQIQQRDEQLSPQARGQKYSMMFSTDLNPTIPPTPTREKNSQTILHKIQTENASLQRIIKMNPSDQTHRRTSSNNNEEEHTTMKSIKLPSFKSSRQSTVNQPVPVNDSPPITPSTSTKSNSSFWSNNSLYKKKISNSSKSDSFVRLPFFIN